MVSGRLGSLPPPNPPTPAPTVSLNMFLAAFIGNTTYALSVFLQSEGDTVKIQTVPFLVGR